MDILVSVDMILAQATQPCQQQGWAEAFVQFYADNLRSSLFAGFLTLGGFLFSAKAFIVVKMKEGVYDTPDYEDKVRTQRALNPKSKFYGPLRNLSRFLFWSILLALVTAVMQLTLGLIPHVVPVGVCLMFGLATTVLLVTSLFLMQANLSSWFDQLEKSKSTDDEA